MENQKQDKTSLR